MNKIVKTLSLVMLTVLAGILGWAFLTPKGVVSSSPAHLWKEYYDNKEERNWLRLLQIDSELEFKQFLYSELLKTRADGSPAIQNDDFSLLKYCLSKTKLAISGEGVTNGIPNCE